MHHSKTRLCLAIVGALALGASATAGAQSSDSTSRSSGYGDSSGYGRWDDNSTDRPNSWIPLTSYGYVGANIGESHIDLGTCAPGLACDNQGTGYKVYTGGKFSRILGVELGYVNLGDADRSGGQLKAQGVNLSVVGNVPIGEQFNIYAKVGGIYGWTKSSATAPGWASGEEEGLNWSYGAGVQFDFNRHWAIVGDYDHYRFDYVDRRDDANLYSVGVVFKF